MEWLKSVCFSFAFFQSDENETHFCPIRNAEIRYDKDMKILCKIPD